MSENPVTSKMHSSNYMCHRPKCMYAFVVREGEKRSVMVQTMRSCASEYVNDCACRHPMNSACKSSVIDASCVLSRTIARSSRLCIRKQKKKLHAQPTIAYEQLAASMKIHLITQRVPSVRLPTESVSASSQDLKQQSPLSKLVDYAEKL